MSGLQSFWAHLSFTLVAASLMVGAAGLLSRSLKRDQRFRILTDVERHPSAGRRFFIIAAAVSMAIAATLSVIRVGDVDLSGHLIAYSGELSFATIFFLVVTLGEKVASGGQPVGMCKWHAAQWGWTFGGLALYAVALSGRGPDLYALGYGSALGWAGLAISAGAAVAQRWLIASLSLGIVLAWQFRLTSAVNLWDYAIDPFIFVGASVQTSARVCGSCFRAGTKWRDGRKLEITTTDVVTKAA